MCCVMALSKHELWGVIMTQGWLGSGGKEIQCCGVAWLLKAAEPAPSFVNR